MLAFVAVPMISFPGLTYADAQVTAIASVGLMLVACALFIARIEGLRKDGALHFPDRPAVPVPCLLLIALAGPLVGIPIIHFAGLIAHVAVSIWTFIICSGLGLLAALRAQALQLNMPASESHYGIVFTAAYDPHLLLSWVRRNRRRVGLPLGAND